MHQWCSKSYAKRRGPILSGLAEGLLVNLIIEFLVLLQASCHNNVFLVCYFQYNIYHMETKIDQNSALCPYPEDSFFILPGAGLNDVPGMLIPRPMVTPLDSDEVIVSRKNC